MERQWDRQQERQIDTSSDGDRRDFSDSRERERAT